MGAEAPSPRPTNLTATFTHTWRYLDTTLYMFIEVTAFLVNAEAYAGPTPGRRWNGGGGGSVSAPSQPTASTHTWELQ